MKLKKVSMFPLLMLMLAIGGCSSMSGSSGKQDGGGAPVSDAGMAGAATVGAREGGSWNGNPLDDPNSLVSTRIIYFDYDSASVREDYRDVVIAHGAYLVANPTVVVTVEGHADERGSREYNIGLGERRADSVRRLMLSQGVAEHQITTVSFGEERPLVAGSDEAAWAQNRRVELLY